MRGRAKLRSSPLAEASRDQTLDRACAFPVLRRIRRVAGDERGAVAAMFAIMLVPLVAAIGAGVDFTRASEVQAALQTAADAAALAGASAFDTTTCPAAATTAATAYMTQAIGALPPGATASFAVTTGTLTSGKQTTAYTVAVTATAKVSTTFMRLFMASVPAAVSATAANPIVTATIQLGSFNSSAADKNSIAWYAVPCDNSVPPNSALTTIFSNVGPPPSGAINLAITSTQKIGFALINVTGGQFNYGNNQYGGTPGSIHYFYSHLNPPSQVAYPSVTQNCSLQVFAVTTGQTPPAPTQGICFTAPFADAAPNCAGITGQTLTFDWNDMGGNPDDKDYNDAVYSFSCSTPAGAPSVALVK